MPKRFSCSEPRNRFRILRRRIIMAPLEELVKIVGCGTGRAGNSDSRWNASMSAYIRRLRVTFGHLNKNPGDFPLPLGRSFFLSRWSRSRVDLKSVAKGGPPHFAWYYLAPRVISLVLPSLLTFPSFYSPLHFSYAFFCFSLTSARTVALYSFMKSCARP